MKNLKRFFVCLIIIVLPIGSSIPAHSADILKVSKIKIGCFLDLTGTLAQIGAYGKHGFDMALDQIKKEYPNVANKIEFIVEDTKSVPSEARSCTEKLVYKDNVFALVGGYASATVYAGLVPLKTVKEPPISIISGGTIERIEQEFGQYKWFFHIFTWMYTYQRNIRDFLLSMKEPPKTIFVAYEDTDFGTGHARFIRKYFPEKGFNIVGMEAFKMGATDFTPLLTKVKTYNPDVFYFIGYGGDVIQITKQSQEVNLNPKMFLNLVAIMAPSYIDAVGEDAQYFVGNQTWEASATFPASKRYPDGLPSTEEFIKRYYQRYKGNPEAYTIMTYVSLYILAAAINEVGLDRDKIIDYLEKIDTMTPMGPFKFKESELGCIHQALHDMIVLQYQNGKPVWIYPGRMDRLVYPSPPWGKKWKK